MPNDAAAPVAALRTVKSRLEKLGVHWAVFAGAAAYCYGSRRRVTDIDVLVKGSDLEVALAAIKDVEGVDVVGDLEMETSQGRCRFFMDGQMIERIQRRRLLGVAVPVVPVEDNILFKAILQRQEDQGKHDVEDIRDMVAHEKLDLRYLEQRIRIYRAERRVKPLLRRLGVL